MKHLDLPTFICGDIVAKLITIERNGVGKHKRRSRIRVHKYLESTMKKRGHDQAACDAAWKDAKELAELELNAEENEDNG